MLRLVHGIFIIVVLALAVAAEGCQPGPKWSLTPVTGTVSRAGRPLAGVRVTFWTDAGVDGQAPRTSGLTDAKGRYELHTDAGDRGAAVGRYRVCLIAPPTPDRVLRRAASFKNVQEKQLKDLAEKFPASDAIRVPQEYSSFEKTPLRAEVHSGGGQTFDFDVPDVLPTGKRGRP